MGEDDTIQLMAQFDFSKPISVTIITEDIDDEHLDRNQILEQVKRIMDKQDRLSFEKSIKEESPEVEIRRDKQGVINIENHSTRTNDNSQMTESPVSTIGSSGINRQAEEEIATAEQRVKSVEYDSTSTNINIQIAKTPDNNMETEEDIIILHQRAIPIEDDSSRTITDTQISNKNEPKVKLRSPNKNIETEAEIPIKIPEAIEDASTSTSTNIQITKSASSKIETRSLGSDIETQERIRTEEEGFIITIDDEPTCTNSNTHIPNRQHTMELGIGDNIETACYKNSTNIITQNYITEVTKIYARTNDVKGWKIWVMNLLQKVATDLALVMRPSYQPTATRKTQKQLNQLKNHIFNISYSTVATVLLPLEKNEKFITKFIDMTVNHANRIIGWKIEAKHVQPVYDEMIAWTKQKKKHLESAERHNNTRITDGVDDNSMNTNRINTDSYRINENRINNKTVNDYAVSEDIIQDCRTTEDIIHTNNERNENAISESERIEQRINNDTGNKSKLNDNSIIDNKVNENPIIESNHVDDQTLNDYRISCDTINENNEISHSRINTNLIAANRLNDYQRNDNVITSNNTVHNEINDKIIENNRMLMEHLNTPQRSVNFSHSIVAPICPLSLNTENSTCIFSYEALRGEITINISQETLFAHTKQNTIQSNPTNVTNVNENYNSCPPRAQNNRKQLSYHNPALNSHSNPSHSHLLSQQTNSNQINHHGNQNPTYAIQTNENNKSYAPRSQNDMNQSDYCQRAQNFDIRSNHHQFMPPQPRVIRPEPPRLTRPELAPLIRPEPSQPRLRPEISQPRLRPELPQPRLIRPQLPQPCLIRPELPQPCLLRQVLRQPRLIRPEPSQPRLMRPELPQPPLIRPEPPPYCSLPHNIHTTMNPNFSNVQNQIQYAPPVETQYTTVPMTATQNTGVTPSNHIQRFKLIGRCGVCGKNTSTTCLKCKKISYCSRMCQALDEQAHKSYPITRPNISTFGSENYHPLTENRCENAT